jgi:hypothetical protein
MTPTKEELVAADLVIMNMPYKTGISILSYINGLISSGKFQFDDDVRETIHQVNERNVRAFLLEQGYTDPVDHSIPRDMLVEKGLQAKKLGGHAQYVEWEKEKERRQEIEDIPKKKWLMFEIIKAIINWVVGPIVGLIIGYLIGHHTAQSGSLLPRKQGQTIISIPRPSKTLNKLDTSK